MAVLVYGPQGCGKTRYAEKLKTLFSCERVIDNWQVTDDIQKGDLVITNNKPKQMPEVIRFAISFLDINLLQVDNVFRKVESPEEAKAILKQAFIEASYPVKISKIPDLHPTTYREIEAHIHQIQNILVAEYARYTDLKDELNMR